MRLKISPPLAIHFFAISLSVYDFTHWTLMNTHPGNMIAEMNNHSHPITKWMDINRSAILTYPASAQPSNPVLRAHPIHRWDIYSPLFSKLSRFGDKIKFVDLPNEVRLAKVAEYFGAETNVGGGGIIVCGSPYESANDPGVGHVFEVATGRDTSWDLWRQREFTWIQVGLTAPDQLRQRVAWAFAQLLVIARSAIDVEGSHTEACKPLFPASHYHKFNTLSLISQRMPHLSHFPRLPSSHIL